MLAGRKLCVIDAQRGQQQPAVSPAAREVLDRVQASCQSALPCKRVGLWLAEVQYIVSGKTSKDCRLHHG